MHKFIKSIIAGGTCLIIANTAAIAQQAIETRAQIAVVVDVGTGSTLFSKDADKVFPPASLAKLMTMEVVFNALKNGDLSLDDEFRVSEYAWRTGGAPSRTSTMFAALGSSIRVEDLIQGVVVQAANDGCIILAEGMTGSEQAFVQKMNERAQDIGLTKTIFRNSTGLPVEGQQTTANDLVILAQHLWREYPEFYRLYAQTDFTWNNIFQRNRNQLLNMDIGADGLALGFAEGSGFALVGSVEQNNRRLFAAFSGLDSDKVRSEEAKRMLEWGIRAFNTKEIFSDNEIIGEAKTYGGEKSTVTLQAKGPVSILVPTQNQDRLIARIVYDGPVTAPVEEGTPIGVLRVWVGDSMRQETPLYAAESIGTGSLGKRAIDAIEELFIGWLR